MQVGPRSHATRFEMLTRLGRDTSAHRAGPIAHYSEDGSIVFPLAVVARGDRLSLESRTLLIRSSLGAQISTASVRHVIHDLAPLSLEQWTYFEFRMNWTYQPGKRENQVGTSSWPVLVRRNTPNACETWLGDYLKVGSHAPGGVRVPLRQLLVNGIWFADAAGTMAKLHRLTPCGEKI